MAQAAEDAHGRELSASSTTTLAGVANRTAARRPLHAACANSAQPQRPAADIVAEDASAALGGLGGTTMLFTILCSFSAGLTVFCILNRVHKRALELAIKLAVREVEKEYEGRADVMKAQLARKEEELKKAQDKTQQLVKLHASVPSSARPAQPAAKPPPAKETAQARKEKLKSEGLEVFAMTRPFTDTSFGELLRTTNVEKIEASGS
jgi:hypothetical protein